jgi:hypothetical protein
MLELVFTVCTIVQGAKCHELQPIRLEESTLPIACLIASQQEGAKWVEEHPNYYVQRATCGPANKFARL